MCCVGICGGGSRPGVGAASERLLEFQWCVGNCTVLDRAGCADGITVGGGLSLLDVSVAVVSDFRDVEAAGVHLCIDGGDPSGVSGQVSRTKTELGSRWVVDIRDQEHVIDLSIEVHATVTGVEATSDPSNVRVLEDVGRWGPLSSPANEEDHLLPSAEVVDDASGGGLRHHAVGGELGDFRGGRSVGDGCSVVVETLRGNGSTSLQTSLGEGSSVGERHELFDASVATAGNDVGAKEGPRIDVKMNHACSISSLVGVQLIPLGGGEGRLEAKRSTIVVGNLAVNEDTAVVADARGVQSGKSGTGLRHDQRAKGNAVTIETRSKISGGRCISGDD